MSALLKRSCCDRLLLGFCAVAQPLWRIDEMSDLAHQAATFFILILVFLIRNLMNWLFELLRQHPNRFTWPHPRLELRWRYLIAIRSYVVLHITVLNQTIVLIGLGSATLMLRRIVEMLLLHPLVACQRQVLVLLPRLAREARSEIFVHFSGARGTAWAADHWLSLLMHCLVSQDKEVLVAILRRREQAGKLLLVYVLQWVHLKGLLTAALVRSLSLGDRKLTRFDRLFAFWVRLFSLKLLSRHITALKINLLVLSWIQINGERPVSFRFFKHFQTGHLMDFLIFSFI